MTDIERITSCLQFIQFATRMGVRTDWHEPDEQNLTARVEGTPLNFDNAMSPGVWYGHDYSPEGNGYAELHVIFSELDEEDGKPVRGRDLAVVNLATLCSWASGGRCREADENALKEAYKMGFQDGTDRIMRTIEEAEKEAKGR